MICNYPCCCKTRFYDIEALEITIVYNEYGDHDPNGLIFVPFSETSKAKEPKYKPKPLILRANAEDWIELYMMKWH